MAIGGDATTPARRIGWTSRAGHAAVDQTGVVTVGMYAGSFDPPHLGHLALIGRAAAWCDTLYVVAAGNPTKASRLLDLEERRALLAESTRHLPGVVALAHAGLLVDLANDLGVDVLIRSIGKEQRPELEMAVANERAGGPPTVFYAPLGETVAISSSLVRAELARSGAAAIAGLVPASVADHLAQRELARAVDRH
jgi:pantetheine-phosphate adenylyltransferase